MKLKEPSLCLDSVDLVIITDQPTSKDDLTRTESYFGLDKRENPLLIKYLVAPGTLDSYYWPLIRQD
ncbi:uncharacterized protein BX663DRAFT_103691 [Cokeromyces recurvatus]|uniref:uncharacterized protein n=1 Tax=Cokeromyces recurvatus TaxID=90255 RepID=UPI00221EC963|nr:uncharacterized protein BX663DRAFT_103691 [Cokeromyces recurvatus]KAI7901755.1 hypothetical protein BX663DRAFT_103691 [Cokeromyces recurvatus]